MPDISSLLAQTIRNLAQYSSSPQLDAELLFERVTGMDRTQMRIHPERELRADEQQHLSELVQRRVQGEPIAYILGERGFWSFDLQVNPAVLIPRPETERVVERALIHLPADTPMRVLDLGTGSGAIALAIAQERPRAEVTATDMSAAALEVAKGNASRLQLRVNFVESDWYASLPKTRFELIASNPPYIAAGDPDLDPVVLASEPRSALIAGPSGLEALQHIVAGAPEFLMPGGWLLLEHGWRQGSAVRELLVSAGFDGVASHADFAGCERVTEGQWSHS